MTSSHMQRAAIAVLGRCIQVMHTAKQIYCSDHRVHGYHGCSQTVVMCYSIIDKLHWATEKQVLRCVNNSGL